jgi:hypothetical protein
MMRLTKGLMGFGLMLAFVSSAGAFSLLGPFKIGANFPGDEWQGDGFGGRPQGIGYQLDGDIGGPMFPIEAYRWNIPVITYAYDYTFLQYFGSNGVNAVEEAIAILNALPPASRMSATLSEFPLDTKAENQTAAALGLLDLKSRALGFLLEEMGLANPERFVWGLRSRDTGNNFTNYAVIQMNYDPITSQPSRYVNGVLYNYRIFDDIGPQGGEWASAVEWYQLDPLLLPYSSVAGSGVGSSDLQLGASPDDFGTIGTGSFLTVGQYFSGLTRDDAGALRFLLSPNNMVFETLLPTVLPRAGGTSGSPWAPVLGTNALGTNVTGISNLLATAGTNFPNFVRTALRPGVDKITFQRVPLLGPNFTPFTLRYTDRFINPTNGRAGRQLVERVVLQPDLVFGVRDIGLVDEVPFLLFRTTTGSWTNNAALNSILGAQGLGGPGTINPPIFIEFTDLAPFYLHQIEAPLESDGFGIFWGSFDGTDRPPVVYPQFLNGQPSLQYLRSVILRPRRN